MNHQFSRLILELGYRCSHGERTARGIAGGRSGWKEDAVLASPGASEGGGIANGSWNGEADVGDGTKMQASSASAVP